MKRSVTLLAGTACGLVLAMAGGRRLLAADKPANDPAAVAARQQLVGEWKLNAELSEDPREKMRQARSDGGSGGSGGGGGWGGGGGRGGWGGGGGGGGWGGHGHGGGGGYGGRGGGGSSGQSGEGAPTSRSMLFTATRITVTNLTPEVTVLGPEGEMRHLQADGASHKDSNGTEVKTSWDESRLVVETKTDRGSVKETWSVSEDPRRLTVLLDIRRSYGGEVKVKRVFDPAASDAAPPAAAPADAAPPPQR